MNDPKTAANKNGQSTGLALATGVAVVCLDSCRKPSTWGTIIELNGSSAVVRYGEHAPIWSSNFWAREYLVPYQSEAVARKVVADFDAQQSTR